LELEIGFGSRSLIEEEEGSKGSLSIKLKKQNS
jgi:hypothetical protein